MHVTLHRAPGLRFGPQPKRAVVAAAKRKGNVSVTAPIHTAASTGNLSEVARLLREPLVDVDLRDADQRTPLHLASWNGHASIVELLLNASSTVESADKDHATPLTLAAMAGHVPVVNQLLARGADPLHADKGGLSPLHWAALASSASTVRSILSKLSSKQPACVPDQAGATPLHAAARKDAAESAEALLSHPAFQQAVHTTDKAGRTPLLVAADHGANNVLRVLVQHKADLHTADLDKRTALHLACEKQHVSTVELLLQLQQRAGGAKSAAQLSAQDKEGRTPLHLATVLPESVACKKLTELLLGAGALVDVPCMAGRTPLMDAFMAQRAASAKALLLSRADLNLADEDGHTAMHKAAMVGSVSLAQMLLNFRVPLDQQDLDKRTPLLLAAMHGHVAFVQMLIEHSAQDVDARDLAGWTALHHAAHAGNLKLAKLLLDNHANVNATSELDGLTPLLVAVSKLCRTSELLPLVNLLVQYGADTEAQDDFGNTPLHLATLRGRVRVIHALVKLGADVNASNNDEDTPLHLAVKHDDMPVECTQAIVAAAPPGVLQLALVNQDGWTAADLASQRGLGKLAKQLNSGAK